RPCHARSQAERAAGPVAGTQSARLQIIGHRALGAARGHSRRFVRVLSHHRRPFHFRFLLYGNHADHGDHRRAGQFLGGPRKQRGAHRASRPAALHHGSAHGAVRRRADARDAAVPRRPGRLAASPPRCALAPAAPGGAMTAMLKVRELTKRYLGLTAVDNVSFEVEAGTVVGLIGPNGSGKTTSIDCISGFQPANGGQWSLGGVDLTGLPPHKIARAGLTRSFQTVRAYDELTLLETLCVAAQETDGVGWLQALWRGTPLRAAESAAEARAHDLLATVGLADYATAP